MVRQSASSDESAIGSSSDQQTATACTGTRRPFCMLLGVWHGNSAMLPSLPRQSVRACTCALILSGMVAAMPLSKVSQLLLLLWLIGVSMCN